MMKSITTIALVLLGTGEVMGELTGDEILRRVDENATPETQIFTAEMTIIHRSGSKRIREVKVWMKGDDYTLVKFLAPADVKGAGLLSAGDDLWLYLPVLKRVRRITGKERGGKLYGNRLHL